MTHWFLRTIAGRVRPLKLVVILLSAIGTSGCGESKSDIPAEPVQRGVAITVSEIQRLNLNVLESSSGHLEAKSAPMIAAEVAGRLYNISVDVGDTVTPGQELAVIDPEDYRLKKALAQAEIERVKSLIRAHALQVKRLRTLVSKQSFSQSALDQAEAELGALNSQLVAARVQSQRAQRDMDKSHVTSPIAGSVDERRVSPGDFVAIGTALFHLTTLSELQVRLPFPETLSSVLRRGLKVHLSSPAYPGTIVEGTVSQIRPIITPQNRSLLLIVDLPNPGNWEPGASVLGQVVIEERLNALMLPDVSVVRRPQGLVVYTVEGNTARSRNVTVGERRDGNVEILHGLTGQEIVVMDGAAFLTDGIAVDIKS